MVDFSHLKKIPHEKIKHDGCEFLSQLSQIGITFNIAWKILQRYVQYSLNLKCSFSPNDYIINRKNELLNPQKLRIFQVLNILN